MDKISKMKAVIDRLSVLYPTAGPELNFTNPFETLIATMLSAQCTDKRVNMVTETLFRDYPDAKAMSAMTIPELEERINECGLYRMKAQHIYDTCRELCLKYDGTVPEDKELLTKLPGVGNKTAGVVLMAAFGHDEIPVDTHVFRLAHRIGLVENANTADATEAQLREIIPTGEKCHTHHLLIWHGRRCCKAIKPDCEHCPLAEDTICDFYKQEKTNVC